MVHESLDALKFDLRLQNRRGWVSPAEQEKNLESLPDVADKAEVVGEEPAAAPAPEPAVPQAEGMAPPPIFGGDPEV